MAVEPVQRIEVNDLFFSRGGVFSPTLLPEVTILLVATGLVTHNTFKKTVQTAANDSFDRHLGGAIGVFM